MPDRIIHIRSLTPGSVPTTASFGVGEFAINVPDGKVFLRRSGSGDDSVQAAVVTNTQTTGSISIFGNVDVTGSFSIDTNPGNFFLIKSGISPLLTISASGDTEVYSDLLIIKNFTTKQPVLTVSQSIVQFNTHSIDPNGTTLAGSIYFTSASFFVGLE